MTDARREAFERLDGRYEVRVLEPSPPAVADAPWFADDPTARGEVPAGRELVSPVSSGDLTWDQLAADNPELAVWCAERWLGAWRRLGPAPPELVATRQALHRLAEAVIAPARQRVNGKVGLRFTRGGFGTPFFGDGAQVRVQGTELIAEGGSRAPVTSLRAAAELVGAPDPEALSDERLDVDPGAAQLLGDFYGLAASVLEQLRADADGLASSRVQLWPEHFDLALELGSEAAGTRANYGFSPGDEQHPEPYVYVAPWAPPPSGRLWQARGFAGAELSYAELLAADDQRAAALRFLADRRDALN